jgi:hypothetical protein
MEVTPSLLKADLRGVDSVRVRDAPCSTIATFVVEDGRAGPQKA